MAKQKVKTEDKVNIGLARDGDNVVVTFDSPVSMIVLPPLEAIKVAEAIKEKAVEILRD